MPKPTDMSTAPAPDAAPGGHEPTGTVALTWDRRSSLLTTGVLGGIAGAAYGEHLLASSIGRQLSSTLPGSTWPWRLAVHAAALAGLAACGRVLWDRTAGVMARGITPDRIDQPALRGTTR